MSRLLFSITLAKSLLLAASQSPTPVPCAPLIDFVEPKSRDNLDIFLGGGSIPDNVPVFFDIPRLEISAISPQVKLCIENLTIPTSVGENKCDGWNKCWLVIGRHTGKNLNPEDTQNCASDEAYRGTAPCYRCTCSGSEMGTGSVPPEETVVNSCGLSAQNSWGANCPDVNNGRMTFPYDGTTYSNYSTVQINICPEREGLCDVCRGGGYQPQFRVGLQWINTAEQCFDEPPFTSAGSPMMRRVGLVRAVGAGILLLLAFMC